MHSEYTYREGEYRTVMAAIFMPISNQIMEWLLRLLPLVQVDSFSSFLL